MSYLVAAPEMFASATTDLERIGWTLTSANLTAAGPTTEVTETAARWTSKAGAPAVGAAIGGAVIGYVVQSAFTDGDVDPKLYCEGLSRLN